MCKSAVDTGTACTGLPEPVSLRPKSDWLHNSVRHLQKERTQAFVKEWQRTIGTIYFTFAILGAVLTAFALHGTTDPSLHRYIPRCRHDYCWPVERNSLAPAAFHGVLREGGVVV